MRASFVFFQSAFVLSLLRMMMMTPKVLSQILILKKILKKKKILTKTVRTIILDRQLILYQLSYSWSILIECYAADTYIEAI